MHVTPVRNRRGASQHDCRVPRLCPLGCIWWDVGITAQAPRKSKQQRAKKRKLAQSLPPTSCKRAQRGNVLRCRKDPRMLSAVLAPGKTGHGMLTHRQASRVGRRAARAAGCTQGMHACQQPRASAPRSTAQHSMSRIGCLDRVGPARSLGATLRVRSCL